MFSRSLPSLLRSTARFSIPRVAASSAISRTYATQAAAAVPEKGKMLVNFVLPHQSILTNADVTQVNLVSSDGDIGILADHVPSIAQLAPGVIEIFGAGSAKPSKYFVSGGFAVINPDSTLNINAVEAVSLDDIDFEAAKRATEEANRRLSAATTEEEKAAAKIELSVYEALSYATKK